MIIIACSCSAAVIADDRETGIAELKRHMTSGTAHSGPCVPPAVAYIGEADSKVSLTIDIEPIGSEATS